MKGRIMALAAVFALLLCGAAAGTIAEESEASSIGSGETYSYVFDSDQSILYINIDAQWYDYDFTMDLGMDLSDERFSGSGCLDSGIAYEIDSDGNMHLYGPVYHNTGTVNLTGDSLTVMIEYVMYLPVLVEESSGYTIVAYPGTFGVLTHAFANIDNIYPDESLFKTIVHDGVYNYGLVIDTSVSSGTYFDGAYIDAESGVPYYFPLTFESCTHIISIPPTPVSSISISGTSIVDAGESVRLFAYADPISATDKTVSWSSSDTSIAEIDEYGILTTRSSGTVVITATANDGSGTYATTAVSIYGKPTATSITVSGSSHYLKVGGQMPLSASVRPSAASQNVEWSSSNPSFATVNSYGVVIAKAAGTVTITASATDGSNAIGTYQLTVVSITLSAPSFCVVGETLGASASANHGSITWSVSDSSKARVNGSTITILSTGTFSLTATEVGSGASTSIVVEAYSKLCFTNPTNGVIMQCIPAE